jgi:hypothetical protein
MNVAVEKYGELYPNNDDPPWGVHECLEAARELYETEPTGGNLHIVLDDGNLEAHHVGWCLWKAVLDDDHRCAQLAYGLLGLSGTQRGVVYRRLHAPPDEAA